MPQATDELRAKWFLDGGGDDQKALRFLEDAGFKLTERWDWISPKPTNQITDEEWSALEYMCQEWDYGGIVTFDEGPPYLEGGGK